MELDLEKVALVNEIRKWVGLGLERKAGGCLVLWMGSWDPVVRLKLWREVTGS